MMKRRLGIAACYLGEQGDVADYLAFLLQEMAKELKTLVVVCNGKLSPAGRNRLEKIADITVARENRGFDVGAWQFAMRELLGWEKIKSYDELVLFNDTFFGPLFPLDQVFAKMDGVADFWGLACHYETTDDWGICEYGYLPTHIQTYFITIGRKMLCSYEFKNYWEKLPLLATFEDAVCKHEAVFTKHFDDMGFTWQVYVDTDSRQEENRRKNYNYDIYEPYWLIKNHRMPILKKSNFVLDLSEYLRLSLGNEMYRCMEYIDKHTTYDVNLIWDYILIKYNIADIFQTIGLRNVLPIKQGYKVRDDILANTLVIMHIHYNDQVDFIRKYVANIPEQVHILMTASREETLSILKENFGRLPQVEIRQKENRGRDLSSLLVAAKETIKKYKYICFVHDKKNALAPRIASLDFQEILWENLLGSRAYISNILHMFEDNPRLGIVGPPPPMHGEYTATINNLWQANFANLKKLAERLAVKVPLDENKEPLLVGSAFWCRREALQILWDYHWTYEDFPREPMELDGQFSHALERIFPYIAQQAGYYTAIALTPRQASVEARNSRYLLDNLVGSIRKHMPPYQGFCITLPQQSSTALVNAYDHYFPYHLFHRGDKVMLYGAGNIGKQFYHQGTYDKYVRIVGIVDRNAERIQEPGIPVQSLQALQQTDFDYVLITMNMPPLAKSGRKDILRMGVPNEKIKWDGPVYYRDHFYQNFYWPLMEKTNPLRLDARQLTGESPRQEFFNPHHLFQEEEIEVNKEIVLNQSRDISPQNLIVSECNRILYQPEKVNNHPLKIDVIVPIYNAFEHLKNCVESVLKNTSIEYDLYLIDDKSTDIRIAEYLKKISQGKTPKNLKDLNILTNEENMGFVKTVNKGLRLSSNDVVILNTDTEVPQKWLERFVDAYCKDNSIASITPFSNKATICSFPDINVDSDVYKSKTVDEIDKVFRECNFNKTISIPTGVGFCMFMSRKAIDDIGVFDEIFEEGYGEENDWCMRAVQKGYKNVFLTNLYVYHKNGASFKDKDIVRREALRSRNGALLSKKYPEYDILVQEHLRKDPAARIRKIIRWRLDTVGVPIMFITPRLDGGTKVYQDLQIPIFKAERTIYTMYLEDDLSTLTINNESMANESLIFDYSTMSSEMFSRLLMVLGIGEIFINHLIKFPLSKTMSYIIDSGIPYSYFVHDYYAVCPRYNLVDSEGEYCGAKTSAHICNKCFSVQINSSDGVYAPEKTEDIYTYRAMFAFLFQHARKVIVPSICAQNIVNKYYPFCKILIKEHELGGVVRHTFDDSFAREDVLSVAVLGTIYENKGYNIILNLAKRLSKNKCKIVINNIGSLKELDGQYEKYNGTLCGRGKYNRKDISNVLNKYKTSIVLIPSIWPETFSYTTHEAIESGYPVLCFNLGAQADFVKKTGKGWVLDEISADALYDKLIHLYNNRDEIIKKANIE